MNHAKTITTSIAPWLNVRSALKAVNFYKAAFGAVETYRLEGPDGSLIAMLAVDGAEFWVSDESPGNLGPESLGGDSARIILTVGDPDTIFAQALSEGAIEVFPVTEGYGWRVGRLADPFGHHWEIGHPLD